MHRNKATPNINSQARSCLNLRLLQLGTPTKRSSKVRKKHIVKDDLTEIFEKYFKDKSSFWDALGSLKNGKKKTINNHVTLTQTDVEYMLSSVTTKSRGKFLEKIVKDNASNCR
jgi:hypothetical protein